MASSLSAAVLLRKSGGGRIVCAIGFIQRHPRAILNMEDVASHVLPTLDYGDAVPTCSAVADGASFACPSDRQRRRLARRELGRQVGECFLVEALFLSHEIDAIATCAAPDKGRWPGVRGRTALRGT